MDRIKELLAKGVGNLTAEELAELSTLLAAEEVAQLDGDDLAELEATLRDAADERLDADATDEVIAELHAIAEGLDTIKAENEARVEAAAEKERQRDEIAKRIRGESGDESDDEADSEGGETDKADDESGDDDDDGDDTTDADDKADESDDAKEPAVVADAKKLPATPRRTPSHMRPAPRQARQAALIASASGRRLDSNDAIFREWSRAADMSAHGGNSSVYVASSKAENVPDDLVLTMSAEDNARKIERRASIEAVVAAGGVCAPVPYRYDLPTVGDTGRPVRDALARFVAQRGGVRTFTPPTIAAVSGAFSQWTHANDITPSDPATKPVLTIPCDDDEVTTMVYAITEHFKVGNFRERWFPEQVAAYQRLANVYHGRFADSKLLAAIAAGSTVVTYGKGGPPLNAPILSPAHDIPAAIRTLVRGIRYRHRLSDEVPVRVIGFQWVRDLMIVDLIRQPDGRLDEKLRELAEAEINAMFTEMNVNVAWSPDYQFGQAANAPGGPFTGTQAAGLVNGFPTEARFYVFIEGSWLFLDGGELNLGVYRDGTLIGTNDLGIFAETFENAHYHGVPGESYVLDVEVIANGQQIAPTGAI